VELIKEYLYEIKKSKFYAFNYKVDSLDEVNNIIELLKKEHKKARHIVYAYKIDGIEKKFDDGEPSGTAGMPLYNIINKKDLNHTLLVVVRYFGGIKLGAGGLLRAYNTAGSEVTK
jgi:uncharacterized YigZ family protein